MEDRRRGALHASASAPALPARDGGAYAHSHRVERVVPPLALVPLDQLQRRRRRTPEEAAEDDGGARRRGQPAATERNRIHEHDGGDEEPDHYHTHDQLHREEQQQQRLGERFLGMMALLARLRRMDLHDERSEPPVVPVAKIPSPSRVGSVPPVRLPPTALETLMENKKRAERSVFEEGGTAAVRAALALSPAKKPEPVENVATKPLREHLTFEISMLLPAPMDTRQSVLHSPIERKPKRTKAKRRRRHKRRPTGAVRGPDGKRTWQTSHVTWVAHASADYAQAREAERMAASAGSRLVAKFASLRPVVPADHRAKYLDVMQGGAPARLMEERRHGRERKERQSGHERVEEEEEEEEEEREGERGPMVQVGGGARSPIAEEDTVESGSEEEEDDDDEAEDGDGSSGVEGEAEDEQADRVDPLPELLSSASFSSSVNKRPLVSSTSMTSQRLRPMQTHQAAYISPELRTWLIHSGLFRTTTTHESPISENH